MEKIIEVVGIIFWGENYYTNNRNPMREHIYNKRELGSSRTNLGSYFHNILYNIRTFIFALFKKNQMAELTGLGYALLKWFGIPIYLLAWWQNLDNWKGGAMSVLGCLGMCAYIYLTYQKARKIRIENDEKEFHLQMKKYGRESE